MESLEFLELSLAWTLPCFLFMCCFMFLFAANGLLHSGHFTFAWSCWCFWCWWWFKKDLGASLQGPTKHIHLPGMADAVCILRVWSLKYALDVVLYLQSAESVQERVLSFESFGETLLSYSDEVTEAMHSQIRLFEDAHRYINNKKGSSSHAKMQHRSIVHINSINID